MSLKLRAQKANDVITCIESGFRLFKDNYWIDPDKVCSISDLEFRISFAGLYPENQDRL